MRWDSLPEGYTEDGEIVRFKPNKAAKPTKYKNKATTYKQMVFDSKLECLRYQELELLQQSGRILELQRQVSFDLIVNGQKLCKIIPDFTYFEDRRFVVEDSKGYWTDLSKFKWRLFRILFPSTIIKITDKKGNNLIDQLI
jgi:hypothetical protein